MKQQLYSEISRLRQTMTKLLPPTLSERGIEKALRDYTRQQAAANEGIRFTFESEIKVRPSETVERMLYRVAQEALANAIRHALNPDRRLSNGRRRRDPYRHRR